MKPNRGAVVLIEFDPKVDHEQRGTRPRVVTSCCVARPMAGREAGNSLLWRQRLIAAAIFARLRPYFYGAHACLARLYRMGGLGSGGSRAVRYGLR